ncbi:serine/threonine protein kinase [Solirubrobacter sp. CPCC 204708]|nr:serine/threonine protein kinase [Solirubrobacter deserti]
MLAPGDIVAGYRIDGVLGRGGMGVVYTATQLSLNRTVALKFLADVLTSDQDFRERFRREGLIQAALDHPNIVPVYEAGEVDEGLFLAMRLVRGSNLKELILGGGLSVARALRVLGPIADALDAAHEAELIHRDIKPQNILVGARDHAYLADFGLTKEAGATGVTKTGQFVGTFDYVAPELISGEIGGRGSDQYALTAVLYECLTGEVPFVRLTDAALLYAHVADPAPSVTARREDLPEAIDAVIARGLAKVPGERFESASAMVAAAAEALADVAEDAPGPFGSPMPTDPRRSPTTVRGTTRAAAPRADTPAAAQDTPASPLRTAAAVATPPPAETAPDTRISARVRSPQTPARETRVSERRAGEEASGAVRAAPSETPASGRAAAPASAGAAAAPETRGWAGEAPAEAREAAPETRVSERGAQSGQAAPETRVSERGAAAGDTPYVAREAVPETRVSARTAAAGATTSEAAQRRRPALAVLSVIVVGAAVGAFLAGRSGSPEPVAAPAPVTVSAGGVQLTAPTGWRRAEAPVIPGLDLKDPVSIGASDGGAVAGTLTDPSGPQLLPAGFLEGLGNPPATDDRVKLGEAEAMRFRDLRPNGFDKPLTVYVVPLTTGAAAVACHGPQRACDETAASLRLEGHDTRPVGPSAEFAEDVDGLASELEAARSASTRALGRARTRTAQANALAALAGAYREAGQTELAAGPAERALATQITSRVKTAADAYGDAAQAARSGRERAYAQARSAARRAETSLQGAFDRLEEAGYRVG